MRFVGCFLFVMAALPARAGEPVAVPSGQTVEFHEVIRDAPGLGLAYRFRFIAPQLAEGLDFATAEGDMLHLCQSYALPKLPNLGPAPGRVVISLSDRVITFGEVVPDAIQYFEIYRPEGETCVWDDY
ncbi:DUF6497 family protein [Palleronia pontilimi]|nr:DUF6497 family protein [Palleronia pontilimi]